MFELSPAVLGLIVIVAGLGFAAATLIVLRLSTQPNPPARLPTPPPASTQIPAHQDAVLLVESGGRVTYINQAGREYFNAWDEEPNLESLARHTRPSENFLMLCSSEGQTRLNLNGRMVEAISFFTPSSSANGSPQKGGMLVTLHKLHPGFEGANITRSATARLGEEPGSMGQEAQLTPQTLQIFTGLSQAMAASLDLETTLQTILESIERLLPADHLEITVWNPDDQLLIPYRLVGLPGLDRRLESPSYRYDSTTGYTGYLATNRQPLLVQDINTFREARPVFDRQRFPFQSYLGVPLLVADNLVGTLELASLSKESYQESDLELASLLSRQAGIAVNNALLYELERKRSTELAGLANLAQSISSLTDLQDLFSRLIESIAPLIPVEVLGFLVYDENRHVLRGQTPFVGIMDSVVEWYQTIVAPDSRAEELLRRGQPLLTDEATSDQRLQLLDLHHLAQASGIRQAVLYPLAASGRTLGFLLTARKRDGSSFDSNDLRFLAIIAGQVAPIIENAALVQQSRQRANRAETLRRIASLTSSAATMDEILKYSLVDLARLLQGDAAAIMLLDENWGELKLHKLSSFGIPPEAAARLSSISTSLPDFELTSIASLKPSLVEDLIETSEISPLHRLLADEMHIRAAISVPLVARERAIGELILGSFKEEFFLEGDLQTVSTAAGQIAAAIEQSALATQTDQSLRQRVDQLTAVTQVSRELNRTLDLNHLLERVYAESLKSTRADCGTLLLFEPGEMSGFALSSLPDQAPELPGVLLYLGDEPQPQLHPLEQRVLQQGETQVVPDFDVQPIGEQFLPAHAGIRSALVIPIAYQGQIAGLLHLHSKTPDRFGQPEQEIGEAFAIQAAIALGNALRYQDQIQRSEQLKRRVDTLSNLLGVSQALKTEQPLEYTLETFAQAIQSSTQFQAVLISLLNEKTGQLERVASAGISSAVMAELRDHPQSWENIQPLLDPAFQIGRAYFIPSEKAQFVPPDIHTVYTFLSDAAPTDQFSWQPDDLLIVPLFDTNSEPLGLISVDAPADKKRPDQPTLDSLEIFCSQASLVIENQFRLRNLTAQVSEIESQLALAREAARSAQDHLPALLHKDLEQTLTIQQLGQRARRIQAGLDISAAISEQQSRADLFNTLSRELLSRMDFNLILISEPTPGGLALVATMGNLPGEVNPKALLGQKNPLRHVAQSGETLLVGNINEAPEWDNTPLLRALNTRSFVCLPVRDAASVPADGSGLLQSQRAQAALLAVNCNSTIQFTEEDAQLFDLIAHQIAVTLHNLAFLEITSRRLREVNLLLEFSQQLGSLDPTTIIATLIESALQAVPAAHSAMAALWDQKTARLTPQLSAGYADPDELLAVLYEPGEGIAGQVFERRRALNLETVDFAAHYNLSPDNLLHYRNATAGRLPVSSLAVPIMAGTILRGAQAEPDSAHPKLEGERLRPLGVLVLDSANETNAFTDDDLAIIASLVQQTALTLENARLYQASEQRSDQLQALTSASTQITASLEKDSLIIGLLDQLRTLVPFDTGTLWLRQEARGVDRMAIYSALGFEDNDQRMGLTVDIADSRLMDEMTHTGRPIYVPDVRQDDRFQTIPIDRELAALLEEASQPVETGLDRLSWLSIPLISSGRVTGVIALEKSEANFYSVDDLRVATTFAAQAAAGIETAHLYQESVTRARELDQQSQTLSSLNRFSGDLSGSLDPNLILAYATREFLQLLPCTTATVLLYHEHADDVPAIRADAELSHPDADGYYVLQTENARALLENLKFTPGSILPDNPIFRRLSESLGIFNTDDASREPELMQLSSFLAERQTHGMLVVPVASGGTDQHQDGSQRFHGLMLAQHDQLQRYAPEEIELARTICNQVATALQNARLFEETRILTEQLELRVQQRTAELAREHQRSDTLLRIITELSASLDLTQVLNRTLYVLGEYLDAERIAILIDRPGQKELQRLSYIERDDGSSEEELEAVRQLEQILGSWIVQNRQSILVDDLASDDRWKQSITKLIPNNLNHSALGVPLMSGAEALGCLLLIDSRPSYFSLDQLDLVQAATNQVSISVNNAELYRLIRDQAEDLGTMLRTQQIETSRSKAILEAVADGVLVTDASRQITLFNESAEKILGMGRSQVLSRSMEHFAGIFGQATQSWLDRINAWSQDPNSYQPGDTYSERILLEDGRVISVHLAPVSLRNDFLGTVSIFQDITHQVEVERLKSEFVATVSHELRTPMTSIKGYVEILLMGAAGKLSEQQTQFLQIVKSNTERLSVLVNDLLDISQIESGRVTLKLEPVDIRKLLEHSVDELLRRIQGAERAITIEKEFQPGSFKVLADADRISRVLENLLDNAYQYNLPGGKILLRLTHAAEEIQVDIQDSGVGINLENKEQVFERFFRGENPLVLGVAGTGLGLSIVHNIIQMHHGRIWVESSGIPGEGSRFSFTLPPARPEDMEREFSEWQES